MRSKTRGGVARLSKLPSPIPATRSLPFISLNADEVYGECSIDRTVHEMSIEKNKDGWPRNDAEASRYNKNGLDAFFKEYADLDPSVDFMDIDLDLLETKTCIWCNKGGDHVLICSVSGCPVGVHENCMKPLPPKFDDLGNFHCPYCVHKRSALMVVEKRKKALESKKYLSDFLDFKPSGDDNTGVNEGRDRGKEPNIQSTGGERNHSGCEDRMVTNQADHFAQFRTVVKHQRDSLALISRQGDKVSHIQEKLSEVVSLVDSVSKELSSEQNVTMNHEHGILEEREAIPVEDAGQVDDGGHEKVVCETVKLKQRREDEQMHPEASGTVIFDSDTETISRRLERKGKKKAQPQNVDSLRKGKKKAQPLSVDSPKKFSSPKGANNPEKITRSQNVKVTASKKSTKPEASTRNFTHLPISNEKRKRRHWNTDEEEILREAVHKFSSTVKKNLPWRKILDFGGHVFDPTRNPADLKDKWRNMMAKESSSKSRS